MKGTDGEWSEVKAKSALVAAKTHFASQNGSHLEIEVLPPAGEAQVFELPNMDPHTRKLSMILFFASALLFFAGGSRKHGMG